MLHGYGTYGWGMGMGFGWITGLILLILIVWIVVKILNQNNNPDTPTNKSALDILKERYARGEISKQEFEEMKKDIS